jgi:2-C-methyl-D-erythritol 4-phosphate cytidylyltransferase
VDGGIVGATVPREGLFIAQTPQIFRKDVLKAAYDGFDEVQKNESTPITDDAQLVTASGFAVTAVEGDARNIKITTRGDLTLAGALLKSLPQKIISRSGAFEEAKW